MKLCWTAVCGVQCQGAAKQQHGHSGRPRQPDNMCEYCLPKPYSDDHPLLKFQPWTHEKLHYLQRYAHMFTTGMGKKWARMAYLDLFSGPGLGALRARPSQVIDGSPLIALKQAKPFTDYVFVDSDKSHVQALEYRARSLAPASSKKVIPGDCNDPGIIREIRASVPPEALCLAFIDPFT